MFTSKQIATLESLACQIKIIDYQTNKLKKYMQFILAYTEKKKKRGGGKNYLRVWNCMLVCSSKNIFPYLCKMEFFFSFCREKFHMLVWNRMQRITKKNSFSYC